MYVLPIRKGLRDVYSEPLLASKTLIVYENRIFEDLGSIDVVDICILFLGRGTERGTSSLPCRCDRWSVGVCRPASPFTKKKRSCFPSFCTRFRFSPCLVAP
jgi:hypothetical protein